MLLLLLCFLLWTLWRPLLCAAGGVRREGDAREEQRHFQRRHPQPAEGEQVGHSSDVCFYTSPAVIECETELRVECLAQGHAGLTLQMFQDELELKSPFLNPHWYYWPVTYTVYMLSDMKTVILEIIMQKWSLQYVIIISFSVFILSLCTDIILDVKLKDVIIESQQKTASFSLDV